MKKEEYIKFNEACNGLNESLYNLLIGIDQKIKVIAQEIRIRVNKPIIIVCPKEIFFVAYNGCITKDSNASLYMTTNEDIQESFRKMCSYSIYSYQNEIINGYITIKGGHRIGICGTAVLNNGTITNIRDISSFNIRIAREVKNISNELIKEFLRDEGGMLLIGAPSCGKTTLLRDIARELSVRNLCSMKKVVVVDERGELSGTYRGVSQNDLGLSDVLNCYNKEDGIVQAIRALSPDVIICDELGNYKDISAIEQSINAGVSIIASIHAGSLDELIRRDKVRELLSTEAFKTIAILKSRQTPGEIERIYKIGEIYDEIDRLFSSNAIRNRSRVYGVA